MELQASMGTMLGCVARVYLAHYEGDTDLDVKDRQFFMDYSESSYDQGLISAVEEWFPELASESVRDAMNKVLTSSLRNAKMELEACFSRFKLNFGCSDYAGLGRTRECGWYIGLAATLVDLVSTLSAVHIEHETKIRPTLEGLRHFLDINTSKVHSKIPDMTEATLVTSSSKMY